MIGEEGETRKGVPLMLGDVQFQALHASISGLQTIGKNAKTTELVDLTSRLRLCLKFLEELDESWSNTIKKHCEAKKLEELEGMRVVAVVKYVPKICLITEKVKKFLGKRLPDFQYDAGSNRLTFKQKE